MQNQKIIIKVGEVHTPKVLFNTIEIIVIVERFARLDGWFDHSSTVCVVLHRSGRIENS